MLSPVCSTELGAVDELHEVSPFAGAGARVMRQGAVTVMRELHILGFAFALCDCVVLVTGFGTPFRSMLDGLPCVFLRLEM